VTSRRRSSGFTLVEIIVVIAIIAIAAAMVLPSLGAGARQREIRRTLQGFVSSVRRASSIAVFQRRPVELRIVPKERVYSVLVPRAAAAAAEDGSASEEARPRQSRSLLGRGDASPPDHDESEHRMELPDLASFGEIEGGRDLQDEGIVFEFYPNGSSSGGTIELLFDTDRGRPLSYKLTINPLVSEISMEDDR